MTDTDRVPHPFKTLQIVSPIMNTEKCFTTLTTCIVSEGGTRTGSQGKRRSWNAHSVTSTVAEQQLVLNVNQCVSTFSG
jgi:hypothetical protein